MDFLCLFVVGCLSLQAPSEPPLPAWSSAYSEHSTLLEYVVATHYVANDTDHTGLVAPVHRPFEGYWLDDPVTAAAIDEYNVGAASPTRPVARAIASGTTWRKPHGDGRNAARPARKAARKGVDHALGLETRAAPRDHALRAGRTVRISRMKLE